MKVMTRVSGLFLAGLALMLTASGCLEADRKEDPSTPRKASPVQATSPSAPGGGGMPPGESPTALQGEAPKDELPNLNAYLEVNGEQRRVLVNAEVCLRKGLLEQLLTKKRTKEHEAILAADADAALIHALLLATGAKPGSPVKLFPKFEPPTGTPIKVTLEYPLRLVPDPQKKGKFLRVTPQKQTTRVPAQQWVRSTKTGKDLDTDWVFAGSFLTPDPFDKTKPPFYRANDGDVICVSNFDTAMLDVPFNSSKDNDDLSFEAHTERIPPEKTPVVVILEPVLPKKK
jgi:hypothetical protein